MRTLLLIFFLLSLTACNSGTGRQEIDLTEQTVAQPSDGIGHYVYALSLPESIEAGKTLEVQMDWRTVGATDMRNRYDMEVRLSGEVSKVYRVNKFQNTVGEVNLINWINYYFPIPADFPVGIYWVEVRLLDEDRMGGVVPLGFREEMAVDSGYYQIAQIVVE